MRKSGLGARNELPGGFEVWGFRKLHQKRCWPYPDVGAIRTFHVFLEEHWEKPQNLYQFPSYLITHKWTKLWQKQKNYNNELAYHKPLLTYWSSANRLSRRQKIILTGLQIGHSTRITSVFPFSCPHCLLVTLSIVHMFSFAHLTSVRNTRHIPKHC